MTDPLRAGFASSEFWLTVAVAGATTYIGLDQRQPTVVKVVAIVAACLKAAFYVYSRTDLKKTVAGN